MIDIDYSTEQHFKKAGIPLSVENVQHYHALMEADGNFCMNGKIEMALDCLSFRLKYRLPVMEGVAGLPERVKRDFAVIVALYGGALEGDFKKVTGWLRGR